QGGGERRTARLAPSRHGPVTNQDGASQDVATAHGGCAAETNPTRLPNRSNRTRGTAGAKVTAPDNSYEGHGHIRHPAPRFPLRPQVSLHPLRLWRPVRPHESCSGAASRPSPPPASPKSAPPWPPRPAA